MRQPPAWAGLCALALLLPTWGSDVPHSMVTIWATNFGNILSEICKQNTSRDSIYNAYETSASITTVDGMQVVKRMALDMMEMMGAKKDAVTMIVDMAETAAMSHIDEPEPHVDYFNAKKLNEYETIRNNITLKQGYREFKLGNSSKHFSGIPVNMTHSTVHVPTNVYDKSSDVLNTIKWSEKLDRVFVSNFKNDPSMSWQYFGSSTGIMRQYPGVKWIVDPEDPDLYDCRMREWYIRAASSPKDVIVLLDLSGSMTGLRVEIAKHVVLNILDTLNTNDYVNIYNFSSEVEALYPCFADTLVQANLENIRIFKEALDKVETRELANFATALTQAFKTLKQQRETNESAQCNQAIMLITDGAPEKFEQVFKTYNRPEKPVRVFTYLIGRDVTDREAVEWMACANKGYFTHVTTLAEVREQVQKYVPVLARPWVLYKTDHPVIWTGVYADIAGRTGSEATRRGYRLMTSISMPVFDKNSKGKRVARLLGVAGTDVPLSDIQKHAPPHKLGVNGYSFLVDNNGYVLYHPDLRPVHREATKQFQEILKPNYNTVDLAEVEIVDNDEPRSNDTKLFMLRKDMIDRQKAETSLYVRQHLDDMKRVIKRRQKYYYHPVDSTPFSLGIALPDRYGDERVSGQVELTQAGRNREPILDYLEGPNWSVHPDWVYCEYDNQDTDAHSFDTPEDQYRHFLKKAISTSGFQWRSKRVYPVPEVKEPTGRYRSDETRSGTYFCDRDLFQSVVFDAKVTLSFKQGQSSSMGLFHTFGAAHSFVATRSGFTRWKTHWPRDMDVDREDMKFNGVRATDEVWYKRAVDYHDHDPTAFVYSVPFDAGLRNESLVTGAQALFLRKGSKRTPAAVVGMQFLHSRFREKFLSTANCPALGNCSQTCASDDLDCYLLDDSGFVVVSKRHEETGRFFGDVDGTVMNALLNHNVYRRITMFDYQGVCLDVVSTGSSAWTLLTPLRYLQWFASWLGGKMLWLLVQSNLLHLLDINLAWAAETVVNDNMDHGAGGDGDAMYDYDSKHTCVQVADSHQLFKMAHINKTRPRPCDKHVGLYTLNHNTKPLKASLEHCYGIDSSSCSRQFVLEKVPYTNLMMLVVNTLCPCEGDMISIEAHEWEYENGTQCARERLEPYRRRPQSCQSYHAEEENIDMCGRSGATRLVPLAVGWLALLAPLVHRWLPT